MGGMGRAGFEPWQWHGTPGGFINHKCRDACCVDAHRAYQRGRRARAKRDAAMRQAILQRRLARV